MSRALAMSALGLGALVSVPEARAADEPRPITVFVNFEGGTLSPGDDASRDQLSCLTESIGYPAFEGSLTEAQQITEQVRAILSPYAVRVVDERPPAHLAYVMVMVGGDPGPLGLDPGVGGYACRIDCEDLYPTETVLAFSSKLDNLPEIAQTVVHEAAHSWGLDHVSDPMFIMNRTSSGTDRAFSDGCTPLEGPETSECLERHAEFCEAPGTQDAMAELLALRGPSIPDMEPPRIELLSPLDGAAVVPGEEVEIEVEVEDDNPGVGWSLVVPQLQWAQRFEGDAFALRFPAGEYTLRVEATDQAGNEATDQITLRVQDATVDDEPDDDPSVDDGGVDDALDPAPGLDDDGGCRVGAAPSWSMGWWVLTLLLVRRSASRERTHGERSAGS